MFKGKVVVVTGGGGSIGKSLTIAFAKAGATVVCIDSDLKKANEVKFSANEELFSKIIPFYVDVSLYPEVRKNVSQIIEELGKIDILINNAGIGASETAIELPCEDWDRTISTNLSGTFYYSKYVGREMANQASGVIINISSIYGCTTAPERAAYCASKAGINSLTKVMAVELAEYNIRVNAVAPGYILTELVKENMQKGKVELEKIKDRTPMKRLCTAEEVVDVIFFLCSDKASFITGESIIVDGGWTAYNYI